MCELIGPPFNWSCTGGRHILGPPFNWSCTGGRHILISLHCYFGFDWFCYVIWV